MPPIEIPVEAARPPVSIGAMMVAYPRDPQHEEIGATLSVTVPLNPMLAIDLRGGAGWTLGALTDDPNTFSSNSSGLLPYNPVEPDHSALLGAGDVALRFSPFRGDVVVFGRPAPIVVYGWTGLGAVWTEDESPFSGVPSQRALSPSTTMGLGLTVDLSPRVAMMVESERLLYIERRYTSVLELQSDWSHGVGLLVRLGRDTTPSPLDPLDDLDSLDPG